MSDIPRTDEAYFPSGATMDTMKEEMEQLERELAVWKHEVGLLREELAKADKDLEDNISIFIDLKEQRDRLAEALREIKNELGVPQPEYPAPVANAVKIADVALAAVKGGTP